MEVCQSPYTPFCLGGYYFSYCTCLEHLENASVSKQLGSNIPVLALTCIFKPLVLEVMEFREDTVTKTPLVVEQFAPKKWWLEDDFPFDMV